MENEAEIELSQSEVGDALRVRERPVEIEEEEEVATGGAETTEANAIRAEESQRVPEIVADEHEEDEERETSVTQATINQEQDEERGTGASLTEQEHQGGTGAAQGNITEPSFGLPRETILYNAALEGNLQAIRDISQGGDPNLRLQTQAGNSILHIHVAAPFAKRRAYIPFLENMLLSDPTLVDLANNRGDTPLHVAAKFGQLAAVTTFLKGAPELLLKTNKDADTALHLAVRNNQYPVVNFLLNLSGTNILMHYTANTAGKNPLYLAVESGSAQLITLLLEKCTAAQNGGDVTGSVLHAAVLHGNSDIVSQIMDKDAYKSLISTTDDSGLTPVHYAAGINSHILEVLLRSETSATAVYMQDKHGRTAAHLAAQCNDVEGLEKIVTYYPDCCEIVDKDERNIVHYAAMLGCAGALAYFLREIRFSEIFAMEDSRGDTPLHLLARSLPDLPIACLRQVKLLIPRLATWKLKKMYNNDNQTPGDIAHSHNISEMEPAYQDVMRDFMKRFPTDGYTKYWLQQPVKELNKLVTETQRKETALAMLKTARTHLLVATLIATLAFAAGLNVPGGFNQSNDGTVKGGIAVLSKTPAFRAFLVADSIALTSSVIAILIYFVINLGKGKGLAKTLFFGAFGATSISMFALMVAFMAGTYASVEPSKFFAILIILIPSVFVFCYTIFLCTVVSYIKAVKDHRRLDPRKFRTAV